MVVSKATRARAWRDKALATEAPTPPETHDSSKSCRADPCSIGQHPSKREGYVTVDAIKNSMSTMTNTIMQQVSEQVKKAMKAASLARPIPHFDYVPTKGCEPSRR